MMRSSLTSLALAAALVACQKGDDKKSDAPAAAAPADRPAAIGREEMATIDAMAQFIGGLRGAIEPNQRDCDRMAAALAPVMERGKPVVAKANALEQKLAADQVARDWIQKYIERKSGGFGAIATGVEGCAGHPGVQQALVGFIQ